MESDTGRQTILGVDDTPENLHILKSILKPKYRLLTAINGPTALRIAQKQHLDLILLDVMMPGMDGYAVCRALKSDPATARIPVIFVTAMAQAADEEEGFAAGGVDYLTKPVHPALVQARIRNHLALADQQRACEAQVRLRTEELEASQSAAIHMLGEAGHYNDTDTGVHIWRMAAFAGALARAADWPVERAAMLELAAPMHDTGKIGIDHDILKAPRKLTAKEFDHIKTHTGIGFRILDKSDAPLFRLAAAIALHHHEKWDGNGYPDGLAGEDIPIAARICAIADVFDALTMRRPYKEPWPDERAFEVILKDAGSHFDPDLTALFLSIKEDIVRIKESWNAREDDSSRG